MQESWRKDSDKLTFIICQPLANPADQDLLSHVEPKVNDNADQMIGDVNLFISVSSQTDTIPIPQHAHGGDGHPPTNAPHNSSDIKTTTLCMTGELELMIADSASKRKGYGRAALLAFIRYVLMHRSEIIGEFLKANPLSELPTTTNNRERIHKSHPTPPTTTSTSSSTKLSLTAKISTTNAASLSLFQNLGFIKTTTKPNYFGEWELRLPATMCEDGQNSHLEWERKLERWGVPRWMELRYA